MNFVAGDETEPLRRRIGPEEKKSRVVREARRLFVQCGYHNVSMPDIVKAAGVSIGAIYSYFPTKEALARQIHDEALTRFMTLFHQRLSGQTSCRNRLRAFAEVVFDTTERNPELMEYLLFMRHGEFMPGLAPICFSQPFQMLREFIREGIEAGELHPGTSLVSAIAYTGVILRAAELRMKCILTEPLDSIAEELMDNAWATIRA